MKRILIPVFALLFYGTALKAQVFRVGLYGGVNISDVSGADLTDNDNDFYKFGFNVGGLVTAHAGKRNTIEMEIGYSQKGSSQPPDSTNNNNYYSLVLNYIDVALAYKHRVHFNLGKKPTDKFDIEAGFSTGYMFSYSYTVKSIVVPIDLNSTDISLFVGTTYNFSPNFCVDFRYYNSVIPAIKRDSYNNSYFLYYNSWNAGNNLVFQITFRYIFGKDQSADNVAPAAAATPAQQ